MEQNNLLKTAVKPRFLQFRRCIFGKTMLYFPKRTKIRQGRDGKNVFRTVREKQFAPAYVETFFREGETRLFMQWLPRFYVLCVRSLLSLAAYASLLVFPLLVFPSAKVFLLFWFAYIGCFVLRFFLLRIACANLFVVTDRALYRYFRIQGERVDEFRWENMETITIRPWRFVPAFATVTLRRHRRTLHEHPLFRQLHLAFNRYRQPEELDFRDLSLTKPYSIRLVIRDYEELYEHCMKLQTAEGCAFRLQRKGKWHDNQRKTNAARTA